MYKLLRFLFLLLATVIIFRQLPEGRAFVGATVDLFKAMYQEATKPPEEESTFSEREEPKKRHLLDTLEGDRPTSGVHETQRRDGPHQPDTQVKHSALSPIGLSACNWARKTSAG